MTHNVLCSQAQHKMNIKHERKMHIRNARQLDDENLMNFQLTLNSIQFKFPISQSFENLAKQIFREK